MLPLLEPCIFSQGSKRGSKRDFDISEYESSCNAAWPGAGGCDRGPFLLCGQAGVGGQLREIGFGALINGLHYSDAFSKIAMLSPGLRVNKILKKEI